MVTSDPAIEIVPVRPGPLTGATLKVNVPLPLPGFGPVSVIHESFVLELQAQPAPVVTVDAPVPPDAPNVWASGWTA
jgi:hypothetical protein